MKALYRQPASVESLMAAAANCRTDSARRHRRLRQLVPRASWERSREPASAGESVTAQPSLRQPERKDAGPPASVQYVRASRNLGPCQPRERAAIKLTIRAWHLAETDPKLFPDA